MVVMAEALVLVAAKVLEAEFVAVVVDEDKMVWVGHMAMQAAGDLDDSESLQRLKDRKVHVVAEVVVELVVAVVHAGLGGIRFLNLFHPVACNYLTVSAHTKGR